MTWCSVKNCSSNSTDLNISFFSIPKPVPRAWDAVIDRPGWIPKERSKICSKHFAGHQIVGEKRKKLVKGAVPVNENNMLPKRIRLGELYLIRWYIQDFCPPPPPCCIPRKGHIKLTYYYISFQTGYFYYVNRLFYMTTFF